MSGRKVSGIVVITLGRVRGARDWDAPGHDSPRRKPEPAHAAGCTRTSIRNPAVSAVYGIAQPGTSWVEFPDL
jgi:hypothetical protein